MSWVKLFLALILAGTLCPIYATARPEVFFGPEYASRVSSIYTVTFKLIDNSTSPGNSRFETEIGPTYGVQTLATAGRYVLDTLYQGLTPHYGKDCSEVVAVIESFSQARIGQYPLAVASTVGNSIRLNSDYIQYFTGDVKYEFTGILYHESAHIWQWNGNGMAPSGLINGIADYIRLKAGYPSASWGKRGSGYRWDDGYDVTAYFLEYCSVMSDEFVAELNEMMRYDYSDEFFVLILGKSVDELWMDYKSAYADLSPAPEPTPGY